MHIREIMSCGSRTASLQPIPITLVVKGINDRVILHTITITRIFYILK